MNTCRPIHRRHRRAAAVIALLLGSLVLAGCGSSAGSGGSGGGGSDAGSSSGTDSGSSASTNTDSSGTDSSGTDSSGTDSAPPVEGSGPESPQPKQQGGPSITVASLPVGGSATPDPSNSDQQCGSVNWLLGTLPSGVTVQLGDVSLNPSGVFDVGGSGCGSDQTACASGQTWTEGNSGCAVPVTQTDPNSDATVTIEVPGVISCASSSVCDDLRGKLGDSSGSRSQATVTAVAHGSSSSSSESSSDSSSPSDSASPSGT